MRAPALDGASGQRVERHLVEVALDLRVDAGAGGLVQPRDARGADAVLPEVDEGVDRGVEQPVAGEAGDVGAGDLALAALEAQRGLTHGEKDLGGRARVQGVAERGPLVHERVDREVEERVRALVAQQERVPLGGRAQVQEAGRVLEDAPAEEVVREDGWHREPFRRVLTRLCPNPRGVVPLARRYALLTRRAPPTRLT